MKETYKRLLPIIIPALSLQFVEFGNTAIDNIMIGKYDPIALGGTTLASTLFYIVLTLFIGIILMVSPLVGQASGAKNFRLVARTVRTGAWLAILAALIIVTVMSFIENISNILGFSEITKKTVVAYMDTRRWSSFILVALPYRYFLTNQKVFTPVVTISFITLPLNIFFNWILIYGNLGSPSLGVWGAGLATSISVSFSVLAIFITANLYAKRWQVNLWKRFWKVDFEIVKRILKYGVLLGITISIEMSLFAIGNIMVAQLDIYTISAFAVIFQTWTLCFGIILGTCDGASIFVSYEAGAKNRQKIIEGIAATISILVIINLGIFSLIHFVPTTVFSAFLDTTSVNYQKIIEILIPTSLLLILSIGIENFVQLPAQMLRSLNDTKYLPFMQGLGYICIAPTAIYVLAYHYEYKLVGVMLGILIGMSTTACMLILRLRHTLRERHIFSKIETQ